MTKVTVGTWRTDKTGPMQVVFGRLGHERVHFEAPSAERLDSEMQAFFRWFNSSKELDPVLKAAVAHLWFVTIHPFEDGNGRVARAIADLSLARSEGSSQRFYSTSSQIRRERNDYYEILERTQRGDLDITDWLQWFLDCLNSAFDGAELIVGSVLAKAHFWEVHKEYPFNARQRIVINRVLDGFEGQLTTSKWARLAKCSQDTALRDIDDLIERNVLRKSSRGGRSTSYAIVAPKASASK